MENIYYIAFPFKGEYQYVKFTANQIANVAIPYGDDILEFRCENEGQDFLKRIYHNGKGYDVTFGTTPTVVSVYFPDDLEDETLAGTLVEKNIPYVVLKIEQNKNELYNLTDNI